MRSTPPLPSWIRDFRHAAYTNIYELVPDETRLYGTESLFGDWDGEVLLLAKDFAPSYIVEDRLKANDPRPYRHGCWLRESKAMGTRTNSRLFQFAQCISSGKLYGSALAGLLRKDGEVSGSLPNLAEIKKHCGRILEFTVRNMPNLKAIACLGNDASRCVETLIQMSPTALTRRHRSSIEVLKMAHPSRGSNKLHKVGWTKLRERLETKSAA